MLFDNENLNESIYSFFLAQQDYTKKLLIEFEISDNCENYILEYIDAIKNRNDDKYDMLTHKNSKFFFYNFNNFLNRIGEQPKLIRHTKIWDDDFALENLQEKNMSYFVKRLLTDSQDKNTINFSTKSSIEENKIIFHTIKNLVPCKAAYNLIYIAIADNFHDYLKSLPQNELNDIDQDLRRNGLFFFEDLKNEFNAKKLML